MRVSPKISGILAATDNAIERIRLYRRAEQCTTFDTLPPALRRKLGITAE